MKTHPHQFLNWEITPRSQHPVMSLEPDIELPEISDQQDLAIAVLTGQGTLTLAETVVPLKPGTMVLIPAHHPYTLRTQTPLTYWLSRTKPDRTIQATVWVVSL